MTLSNSDLNSQLEVTTVPEPANFNFELLDQKEQDL